MPLRLLRSALLALAALVPQLLHAGSVPTAAAGVRHVFIIMLENKDYADTFGTSTQDPYLRRTLVPRGALLSEYYGTGHVSLDNYIALVSGQAATRDTDDDCLPGLTGNVGNYDDVRQSGWAPQGQVVATGGCIYGRDVPTLPGQLDAAGLSWRGYMEDMGNDPARESPACGHPPIGTGTDNTNAAEAPSAAVPQGDAYATRHDPFVYFHSIIDDPRYCASHVVNLRRLPADLRDPRSTPNLVFITPNLCHDGHDGDGTGAHPCASGEPGGLRSVDGFLRTWVPRILAAPAFRRDGLLVITFDESNFTGHRHTEPGTGRTVLDIEFPGRSCCGQQPGPNLAGARPGVITLVDTPTTVQRIVMGGFGGDRIGALLLSPFVRPGSRSATPYNHYSLLRSIEDIFHLGHIGYAADDDRSHYHLATLGQDGKVFRRPGRRGVPVAAPTAIPAADAPRDRRASGAGD